VSATEKRAAKRVATDRPIAAVQLAEFLSAGTGLIDVDPVTCYKHPVGYRRAKYPRSVPAVVSLPLSEYPDQETCTLN
jgi:hypothetical protein